MPTCQASACRCTPGPAGRTTRSGLVWYWTCGSHSTAAATAGTTHRPSVSDTGQPGPLPAALNTGTAISEATTAPAPSMAR